MTLASALPRAALMLTAIWGSIGLWAADAQPSGFRHYEARSAWADWLPGSWVETLRDPYEGHGASSDDKEILTSVGADGSAAAQRFTREGTAWIQKDYAEVFPGCVLIRERLHWTEASDGAPITVDAKGMPPSATGCPWTVERLPTQWRRMAEKSVRLTPYRWSMRNHDGTCSLELSYADGVSVPTHALRVGRYVTEVLLSPDVVAYRVDLHPVAGTRKIQVGEITAWGASDVCAGQPLRTVVWKEQAGGADDTLTDAVELHLSDEVPGHQVLNRVRRQDGSWRTERLVGFHRETLGHYEPSASYAGAWMHRQPGDWVQVELQRGVVPIDSVRPNNVDGIRMTERSSQQVVLSRWCAEGYPVLATRYLSGPQAGIETIRVDIPFRPLLAQHATEISRHRIVPQVPSRCLDGTEEAMVYAMQDEWNRPWTVRMVRRRGLELPDRQVFSWFTNGTLPADALSAVVTVDGQTLSFQTTDLHATRRIGGRDIPGVAATEKLTSRDQSWTSTVFHSQLVPGVVAFVEQCVVDRHQVRHTMQAVVDFHTSP